MLLEQSSYENDTEGGPTNSVMFLDPKYLRECTNVPQVYLLSSTSHHKPAHLAESTLTRNMHEHNPRVADPPLNTWQNTLHSNSRTSVWKYAGNGMRVVVEDTLYNLAKPQQLNSPSYCKFHEQLAVSQTQVRTTQSKQTVFQCTQQHLGVGRRTQLGDAFGLRVGRLTQLGNALSVGVGR